MDTGLKGVIAPTQRVKKSVPFGYGLGSGLRLQVKLDGEVVEEREGHSLTFGFLLLLAGRMRMCNDSNTQSVASSGDWLDPSSSDEVNDNTLGFERATAAHVGKGSYTGGYIYSCTNGTTARIGINSADPYWGTGSLSTNVHLAQISNVTGTTSINGRKYLSYVTNSGGIYYYDVYDDYARTVGTDTSGDGVFGGTGQCKFLYECRFESTNIGSGNYLLVGRDNTAVTINDDWLGSEIVDGDGPGELNVQGSAAVSQDAIDELNGTGEIQLTEDYVNNSGGSVQVNEVGWFKFAGSSSDGTTWFVQTLSSGYMMVARDTINVLVPNGSTLTLNYTFKTTLAANDGGWLQQFHKLFYRFLTTSPRAAVNYYNLDADDANSTRVLGVPSVGGGAVVISAIDSPIVPGEYVGIVVGTGTSSVDIANYFLETSVPHGVGDGRLVHGATGQRRINIVGSTASFILYRMFYNAGSTGITINEVGLTAGGRSWDTTGVRDVHTILRHSLSDAGNQISVPAGQMLLVEYEISVTVV